MSLLPWTQTHKISSELHPYRALSVCGETLTIVGQCCFEINVSGKILQQDCLIVHRLEIPILGVDFSRNIPL